MRYVLSFNIIPGKGRDFWTFINNRVIPFWGKFDKVKSVEIYTTLGGDTLYEAYVDLPDYLTFDSISKDSDFEPLSVEFLTLTQDLHRKFLMEERQVVTH